MLPLLAPLLGSLLGPSVLGSLGLSSLAPWMLSGIGSGLASLAVERDPQKALMSGLLGGAGAALTGAGGLGNLFGGGAGGAGAGAIPGAAPALAGSKDLAAVLAQASPTVNPVMASLSPGARAMADALPQLSVPNVADAALKGAATAGSRGLLSNPLVLGAGGLLGLGALGYKGEDAETLEKPERRGNNRYVDANGNTGVGPVFGVVNQPSMMSTDDYLNYGQSGSNQEAEINHFAGQESWNRSDPLTLELGQPLEDSPDSSNSSGPGSGGGMDAFELWAKRRRQADRRGGPGFKNGGYVGTRRRKGPGGGALRGGPRGTDKIQGIVDGKAPVRLNSGEYVFSKEAVRAAGGTKAMDALHNQLKGKARGRKRYPGRQNRAAV